MPTGLTASGDGCHTPRNYTNPDAGTIEDDSIYSEHNLDQLLRYRVGWTIRAFESRSVAPLGQSIHGLVAECVSAWEQQWGIVLGSLLLQYGTAEDGVEIHLPLQGNLNLKCHPVGKKITGSSSCWLHSMPLFSFNSDITLNILGRHRKPISKLSRTIISDENVYHKFSGLDSASPYSLQNASCSNFSVLIL